MSIITYSICELIGINYPRRVPWGFQDPYKVENLKKKKALINYDVILLLYSFKLTSQNFIWACLIRVTLRYNHDWGKYAIQIFLGKNGTNWN